MKKSFLKPIERKRLLPAIILFILLLIVTVFFHNNAFLYKKPIVRIVTASPISENVTVGTNGLSEKHYVQRLNCIVLNGAKKGSKVTIENEYSESGTLSEQYRKGNQLFVNLYEDGGKLTATILNQKRDSVLVALLGVLVLSLLLASGRQSLFTLLALAVNTAAFFFCIRFISVGSFASFFWIVLAVFFIIITLLSVGGFSQKTLGAFLSSLAAVTLILLLYLAVVRTGNSLKYETMNYVLAFYPLADLYMISVIFGCLGAIMDIAVTINSSVAEIIHTAGIITRSELIDSIREIGHDIMGTMVNVLFFSYISSSLPLIVLRLCHDYSWSLIFRYDLSFELVRFLIGAIGIVSAIPISGIISVILHRKAVIAG